MSSLPTDKPSSRKLLEWSQCSKWTQTVQTGVSSRQSKRWARPRKLDPFRTFIISQKPFKLKKPRLQWADYTSVRQYVESDPPTIVYHSHQKLNTGIPSVVWHQQMEKAYIRRFNNMHMIHKSTQIFYIIVTTGQNATFFCHGQYAVFMPQLCPNTLNSHGRIFQTA